MRINLVVRGERMILGLKVPKDGAGETLKWLQPSQ